ncbi:hypothetical protein EPH_0013790 [Eimeria praecox]|uniref:Transmembrane protein n=1 Tax=Eimeria praecox TaxID=51316 RepID=U6GXF8_9EIME|nr:hypothetical protein EPH_0013790 [Eimeria praecox]
MQLLLGLFLPLLAFGFEDAVAVANYHSSPFVDVARPDVAAPKQGYWDSALPGAPLPDAVMPMALDSTPAEQDANARQAAAALSHRARRQNQLLKVIISVGTLMTFLLITYYAKSRTKPSLKTVVKGLLGQFTLNAYRKGAKVDMPLQSVRSSADRQKKPLKPKDSAVEDDNSEENDADLASCLVYASWVLLLMLLALVEPPKAFPHGGSDMVALHN